jgi:CheY-like chemotaxis protein
MITDVVGEELRAAGHHVVTASGPAEAGKLVRKCAKAGTVLVVTDLRMPTSRGASFWGGFELVRRIRKAGLCIPVVLMAESLTDKARARAKELGIRRVAYKPALSKLDERQYREDLKSFSSTLLNVLRDAEPLEGPSASEPRRDFEIEEDGELLLQFLNTMTEQLVSRDRSTDISRMILQVAERYLDRAIWFLIKQDRACGLAGFGLAPTESESFELARKLSFNVSDVEAFREVVDLRKSCVFGGDTNGLRGNIHALIGVGRAREWTLVPMLSNGEVVAVLYGDNAKSGAPIAGLKGLELFVAHAGIAMENVFLNRRLRSFEEKLKDTRDQDEEPRERASNG